MARKRCKDCGGSGRVMGGGMMLADCEHCDGEGKIYVVEDPIDELLAKNTEHYQKAKNEIKEIDPRLSDGEAEQILDAEINKQMKETVKKNKR